MYDTIITIIWLIAMSFWIWMLIDAIKRKNNRWTVILILLGIIAAIVYYWQVFGVKPLTVVENQSKEATVIGLAGRESYELYSTLY